MISTLKSSEHLPRGRPAKIHLNELLRHVILTVSLRIPPCATFHGKVKCYLGVGDDRQEMMSVGVGGYFGEVALLRHEITKVR